MCTSCGSTRVEAHACKYTRGTKQCSNNILFFDVPMLQSVFQCSEQNNVPFFNVLYIHSFCAAADNIVSAYLLFLSFVVSFTKSNRSKNHIDNPFLSTGEA